MSKFLTVKQVAELLLAHRDTVIKWCNDGVLKHYQPGKKILIAEADLKAFLEARAKG